MADGLSITPIPAGPFSASITPPGSKSLTNRALVLSVLAEGPCMLSNVLFADDTMVMLDSLGKLGFDLQIDQAAHTVRIAGQGGRIPQKSAELFCGNSGTTIRFLTALASLGHGDISLDGIPRMRQRPIEQLVDLLKNLGVRIEYGGQHGFPPLTVHAHGLPGGLMQFQSGQSSQFLSAILQVAPYARREIQIDLLGDQASWPYVVMTMRLMDVFGHTPHVIRDPGGKPIQIIVPQGKYQPTEYAVEPDASNASYFLAAAAIHKGAKVTVHGLGKHSLQGDIGFADLLHEMGADLIFGDDFITVIGTGELRGIEANLLQMPDMAQTLAVVALFAEGTTQLTGLYSLRVKETDRVAALAKELTKLGASVIVQGDDLIIDPPHKLRPAAIDTYDDHRMAMSFAVAGTAIDGVVINDPQCVNKTYPNFFDDLAKVSAHE
jgi:3-phosphoshikimate 1-carboxyvinyltransferase